MDIIVTIPKNKFKDIEKEEAWAKKHKNAQCFWKISKIPKKLKKGDKVYFIENGAIKSYNIFIGIDEDCKCEVTGTEWPGLNLIMEAPSITLKKPIPMKGFRGFRYYKKLHKDARNRQRVNDEMK